MNTEARRQDLCSSCPYHDRIISVETITRQQEKRLFGNGQPGELDKLRKEVTEEMESIKKRLTEVEHWMWRVVGFVGACSLVLSLVLKVWAR